jgi:hypothetical protein
MGMRLFYVTVFVFFLGGGGGVAIGRFAVFFKGGSGKTAFFMWCFCGESMVDCVVMVERRHHVLERLKTCHEFEVYFCIGVENSGGDSISGTMHQPNSTGPIVCADRRAVLAIVGVSLKKG